MPSAIARVTIAEVAGRAGVSTATVSRVLNGSGPVTPQTRQRVQNAVAELHYTPHGAARSLARGRTGSLGLLVPEISGNFFAPLLRGIETAAQEAQYDLVVHSTRRLDTAPLHATGPVGAQNTDGLLVFTDSLEEAALVRLHQMGFPVVLLHQAPPDGLPIPCVTFENKNGARLITQHLIEVHGFQRIAFLRGPAGHQDSLWRERGYREALAQHGLPIPEDRLDLGGFNPRIAEHTLGEWIRQGRLSPPKSANPSIQAIFTGDDDSAFGALRLLQQHGYAVPGDIAIVGFDDVPFSQYITPALTTVHAPIEQAGYLATHQLIRLIRGEPAELEILLPTELVIRRSCGCGVNQTRQKKEAPDQQLDEIPSGI